MSLIPLFSLRRALVTTSVSIATLGLALHANPTFAQTITTPASVGVAAQDTTIRPFRVKVPDAALVDLRRRIAATRWPDRETVPDQSQGVQLAKLKDLLRTWGSDYDWRKAEAKLNALPQFITTIDGLEIQFTQVSSPHPNAMPLIMTHGWPGSALELLKVVGPLTNPPAHGGRAEDAFHLVLPTYPGYGFSGKPAEAWDPGRVARA